MVEEGDDVQTVVERSRKPRQRAAAPVQRVAYLDTLKLLLVAVIIAGHAFMGYSGFENAWPYQSIREVALTDAADVVLGMLVLPPVLFAMGLFFLLSGLVTPPSLARKGPRTFARDRLVRLGVPLAAWALAIWPALIYAAYRAAGEPGSFWWRFTHNEPVLDVGPMWFVEVLLIFSLAYAAWAYRRGSGAGRLAAPPLRARTLVAVAAGISVASILVRLALPFNSAQPGQLKLWQWPQFAALFGLGVAAARRGWLDPVPERLRRRCGAAALLGGLAVVALVGAVVASGLEPHAFERRLHWSALGLAALEGPLAVAASVWLLGAAQRHLDRPPGPARRALARSAFAAFIVQGPVLIGLALALRGVDAAAEVKALTVAVAGVAASFGLAWLLVTRTRLGRVL